MTQTQSGFVRFAALSLLLALGGCGLFSGSKTADTAVDPATLPPPDVLYASGITQLQQGNYDKSVTIFDEVEQNYPYSTWATHAQLMHGYAQYKQLNYDSAIDALNRYISLHPQSQDVAYAYYLKALCYYEQIEDTQRDQTSTYEAIQALTDVTTRFPNSAYARDSLIKLRLAQNRLAGHEMEIARFYEKQHLYAAAVGRYQDVIQTFQTTTYVPEALERLTEVYLDLGLTDAAQRTASVLAYNYPGSTWYQAAYAKLRDHNLVASAQTPAPKTSRGFLGIF